MPFRQNVTHIDTYLSLVSQELQYQTHFVYIQVPSICTTIGEVCVTYSNFKCIQNVTEQPGSKCFKGL